MRFPGCGRTGQLLHPTASTAQQNGAALANGPYCSMSQTHPQDGDRACLEGLERTNSSSKYTLS